MKLTQLPRRKYTEYETPIQLLKHLTDYLGGPNIYIKRDDLLGLTGGGNKTRKLEFLVADALNKGADTLITCGAVQSNHCRLTLAAAIKEGLKCRLVLAERNRNYDPDANGNNFLFRLLGVEKTKIVSNSADLAKEMEIVKEELTLDGREGYIVAEGGGNKIGALGYVVGAQEILKQAQKMEIDFNHIVVASGSGGTHAGLVTGLSSNNCSIPVTGINVRRNKEPQEEKVYGIVKQAIALINLKRDIPKNKVTCFDDYLGPGYAIPTKEVFEAIHLLAETEGILLDPVYTGKSMAGLIDLVKKGYFSNQDNILYIHTGGTPSLFANTTAILEKKY